jgi:hypothetical protein
LSLRNYYYYEFEPQGRPKGKVIKAIILCLQQNNIFYYTKRSYIRTYKKGLQQNLFSASLNFVFDLAYTYLLYISTNLYLIAPHLHNLLSITTTKFHFFLPPTCQCHIIRIRCFRIWFKCLINITYKITIKFLKNFCFNLKNY